jgi:hypothetical protein
MHDQELNLGSPQDLFTDAECEGFTPARIDRVVKYRALLLLDATPVVNDRHFHEWI